jgi:phosphopantetheine adenylyltransferase
MFGALFSFLGGSVFRMVWGEVASFFQKKQDHEFELERVRLQGAMEAAQHDRNMAAIKLQSDLGIKVIEAQRDSAVVQIETDAWLAAVKDVGRQTGIRFLDIWNGAVRPLLATLAILVIVAEVIATGFILSEWHKELVAAILGLYVADRSLSKRGK